MAVESKACPSKVPLAYNTAKRLNNGAGVGFGIVTGVGKDATTAVGGTVGATTVCGIRTFVPPIRITPGLAVIAVNVGAVNIIVALGDLW